MFRTTLLLPTLVLAAAAQAQVQVYSNDFSTNGAGFSNGSTVTSNGESFLADSVHGFGNGTDTLTLTGLAAHSSVTVSFDLYIIESWDGDGPAGGNSPTNPDAFGVFSGATQLFRSSFANYSGGNTQSYPTVGSAPKTGAFQLGHLGYGTGDFGDTTYRLTASFAHTASSLALDFTSFQNQGVGDEGWGLDNVKVIITPVPEPTSLAALGLGALALARRRRKA